MICKYCGKPVSGGTCTSCNKTVSLSYVSHELSDILEPAMDSAPPAAPPSIGRDQLHAAYEEGFASGKKHGYSIGWDAAQKDALRKYMRKQRFLMIIAASAMLFIAVICSLTFNSIGYSRGNQQGKTEGKQEQKAVDEAVISEKLKSERLAGRYEGYRIGYGIGFRIGKAAGYPASSPTPVSTQPSEPPFTPSPIVLKMNSTEQVRQLQQRLIQLGLLAQKQADGRYGPKTKNAIEKFQEQNNITPVDGSVVRQDLWDMIMRGNNLPTIPAPTPTPEADSEEPGPTAAAIPDDMPGSEPDDAPN